MDKLSHKHFRVYESLNHSYFSLGTAVAPRECTTVTIFLQCNLNMHSYDAQYDAVVRSLVSVFENEACFLFTV